MSANRHARGRPVRREIFGAAPPPHRSRLPLVLSLLLHALVLANLPASNPAVSRPGTLAFVAVPAEPAMPLELNVPAPVARTRPEPTPAPEREVAAVPAPPPAAAEPPPAPEPPAPEPPPPAPEPPAAAPEPPPAVEPGLIGGGRQAAGTEQAGEVLDSNFEREAAQAPPPMARNTAVGVLDATWDTPRPGRGRPAAAVTRAGFDGPARERAPAPSRQGVVTDLTGFGKPAAPEAGPPPLARAAIASGFEADLPDAPDAGAAAPAAPPDSPVEIEFKPMPEYSAAARAAGIEGNVLLEIEFSAAGAVRVLRVVEGLGHGLDALAVRAAEQMRFTPAVRDGRRVDTRAVVSIVFRLT